MMVLSLVDIQAFLFLFEGYAKSNLGSKHHLCALHEIIDGVFEHRLESVWINEIEINFIVGYDLESFVALDVVQLTFEVELCVLFPVHIPCIFILLQF